MSDLELKQESFLCLKLKTCKTMSETYHDCVICKQSLYYRDDYRDGGPGNKAHEWCVQNHLRDDLELVKLKKKFEGKRRPSPK